MASLVEVAAESCSATWSLVCCPSAYLAHRLPVVWESRAEQKRSAPSLAWLLFCCCTWYFPKEEELLEARAPLGESGVRAGGPPLPTETMHGCSGICRAEWSDATPCSACWNSHCHPLPARADCLPHYLPGPMVHWPPASLGKCWVQPEEVNQVSERMGICAPLYQGTGESGGSPALAWQRACLDTPLWPSLSHTGQPQCWSWPWAQEAKLCVPWNIHHLFVQHFSFLTEIKMRPHVTFHSPHHFSSQSCYCPWLLFVPRGKNADVGNHIRGKWIKILSLLLFQTKFLFPAS